MITITNKEVITEGNWQVESVQILNLSSTDRYSIVSYVLRNKDGLQLDKIDLEYRNEKYTEWYNNFNNMKYLEQELAISLSLNVSEVNTKEQEYLN